MNEEKIKEKIKRILTTTGYTTELNKHEVLFYIEDLQQRINKAIEYINKYESIKAYYEYVECGYEEYNYDNDFKDDLLEILKGAE